MELRHLRYFLAVADAAHFTKAAQKLWVSQPTLSQQIKQLEEELGAPLFHRGSGGVQLTGAGEKFRPYAERALHEMEAAVMALGE
ncbi:MAG: LysR family transcriptional regulator, partial [Armatimonadetes bacterium]|nr:LysR family transcriptional regulator [Armatimonadota bacterium]